MSKKELKRLKVISWKAGHIFRDLPLFIFRTGIGKHMVLMNIVPKYRLYTMRDMRNGSFGMLPIPMWRRPFYLKT